MIFSRLIKCLQFLCFLHRFLARYIFNSELQSQNPKNSFFVKFPSVCDDRGKILNLIPYILLCDRILLLKNKFFRSVFLNKLVAAVLKMGIPPKMSPGAVKPMCGLPILSCCFSYRIIDTIMAYLMTGIHFVMHVIIHTTQKVLESAMIILWCYYTSQDLLLTKMSQ